MIDYGEEDIVLTTKLSGSHLTVINTPYVQKIGTKASWFEGMLLRNKTLKKWAKMFVAFRGMKAVENAATKSNVQDCVVCWSIDRIRNSHTTNERYHRSTGIRMEKP